MELNNSSHGCKIGHLFIKFIFGNITVGHLK